MLGSGSKLVRVLAAAVFAICLGTAPANAAPEACPSAGGVSLCLIEDGDSTLEVQASSLGGGWVRAAMGVGGVFDLPLETFRIWSFDDDQYIDSVLEEATRDTATRQIRVQFLEISSAVRTVGVFTLADEGSATVIEESVAIRNLLSQRVRGRLYVFSDFDLADDVVDDDIAVTEGGARIEQRDGTTTALLEAVDPPTGWDVAVCCSLYDVVESASLVPLLGRNSAPGPADFQAAWSWDREIGAGKQVTIAVRKTYTAPEPGGGALAGSVLLVLAALRVRRTH